MMVRFMLLIPTRRKQWEQNDDKNRARVYPILLLDSPPTGTFILFISIVAHQYEIVGPNREINLEYASVFYDGQAVLIG